MLLMLIKVEQYGSSKSARNREKINIYLMEESRQSQYLLTTRDMASNEFRLKSMPNTCQNWSIFRIFKCKSFLNSYSLFWIKKLVNPNKKRDSKESL
jgi:hypothetical protein